MSDWKRKEVSDKRLARRGGVYQPLLVLRPLLLDFRILEVLLLGSMLTTCGNESGSSRYPAELNTENRVSRHVWGICRHTE